MPKYQITSPDGTKYEINAPEGATEQQALAYFQSNYRPETQQPKQETYDPTEGMSTFDKLAAGAGKALVDVYRGGRQMLGLADQAEIDEAKRLDAPLMKTTAGKVGNFGGNVAMVVPTALIPGANTYTGSALVGSTLGMLQPTQEGESRVQNAALGAAGGLVGKYAGDKVARYFANRVANKTAEAATRKSQDAVKNATLQTAKDAGYVVPPSKAGAKVGSRLLEGISGKYKTEQLAGIKNQRVTDSLARKAVGLSQNDPLTPQTMQAIRQQAFKDGYEPIANLGQMQVGPSYKTALTNILNKYQGASRSFPGAVNDDVAKLVQSYDVNGFDAGDALQAIQILRDSSKEAYAAGKQGLGKASREIAGAIENEIENNLASQTGNKAAADMLKAFRGARELMAKSHTIEQALVDGGGKVDATKLATMVQKGKPLTKELKTIGQFANNFREVARVPKSGDANPLTVVDIGFGSGMAGVGNPVIGLGLPAARIAARQGILSQPYQNAFVQPNYDVSGLLRLNSSLTNSVLSRPLYPGVGAYSALNWQE